MKKRLFALLCGVVLAGSAVGTGISVSAMELGDVDSSGEINAIDASAILLHSARTGARLSGTLSEEAQGSADVNYDGYVNAQDASYVLVYSALKGSGSPKSFRIITADRTEAVYLGVVNYGKINKKDALNFKYRFKVNGEEKIFTVDNSSFDEEGNQTFRIQNLLKENYHFVIAYQDDEILDVEETEENLPSYTPPISGTAGKRTVLNFLKTAMEPVGTTLYMYGGGWNWQDDGSAWSARTIGVNPDWIRFWNEQTADYTYRDLFGNSSNEDPPNSYYPYGEYNEYYYTGLDCSGYVGWTIYNTLYNEDGKEGIVGKSTQMAKRLSSYGWGDYSRTISTDSDSNNCLKAGDIMSIGGHVWISLGTCSDGSILISHSTPSYSVTGQPGGGVQLSAVGSSKSCEAYQLASSYMYEYFPAWCERYSPELKGYGYISTNSTDSGRFRWNVDTFFTDPENVQNLSPEQVLKLVFDET